MTVIIIFCICGNIIYYGDYLFILFVYILFLLTSSELTVSAVY